MNLNTKILKIIKLISIIENKYINNNFYLIKNLNVGDIILLGYKITEGNKERTQVYEGIIIAKQNKTISQTFTLKQVLLNISIEHIYFFNSPKIIFITKKYNLTINRSKLYYMRFLKKKALYKKLKNKNIKK